jgi:hypothetical protein
MDTTRLRDNLFSRLFVGVTLDPADETKVKASLLIWAEEIVAEVGRAQIEFEVGDIGVGPGTFEDDQNNPISGEGETLAATIDGRIT